MSEPRARTPTSSRRGADRWSARKTLIFIIAINLFLWAMIGWLIHVL